MKKALLCAVIGIVVGAACTPQGTSQRPAAAQRESLLAKIQREHRLVVGYAGYPPYLRRDANTRVISGYSVDLLRNIVEPLNIRVEWRETTWDNMKQDLVAGKFDLMVEPIFMTEARASQMAYTKPYAYFGYAIPVIRRGDKRFHTMADLNNPGVTIAITQGV